MNKLFVTFWNIGSVQKCLTDALSKLEIQKHNKTRGWVEATEVFKMDFLAFPLGDPKLMKQVSSETIFMKL